SELDQIQLMEQAKPKPQQILKRKKIKKSKKSILHSNNNNNNNLHLPKSFLSNEPSDLTDGIVVQLYLSIVEARNIPQVAN
ncbi:unnamed protein product, partial [Rotaria magnacalcarata]